MKYPCFWLLIVSICLLGSIPGAEAQEDGRKRPNILFAIADDWSAGHTSLDVKWVQTPGFDRIAKEGVLFKNCFTSNPKCSPSRATMLTGRNSWQLEEAFNHFGVFPARWAVFPDVLENAGYHIGFTGKAWGPGDWKGGGFKRNPVGPGYNNVKARPAIRGISPIDYAANFDEFLKGRKADQPFYFWYGGLEPHRTYDQFSGERAGKNPADVKVPAYLPDKPAIRSDFLDYAVEVEWFDSHLVRMLKKLEEIGELENTIVIVTADNGMPFPRAKGQIYEASYHLPLAIRWPGTIKPGRVVEDFINVRDFAPTFIEIAGAPVPETVTGRSFLDLLRSEKSGVVSSSQQRMLIGKERHDLGRPYDWGYPTRAIRTPEYLYIVNYEPNRWPVGDPETGYRNCDDSPSKELVLDRFDKFYKLCFGKRPTEELYRVDRDVDCVENLANDPALADLKARLRSEMESALREEGDPRMHGEGERIEKYPYVGERKHAYDTWLRNQ
jgi:N-sulfoglucosamine sulfohydrolase